MSTLRFRFKITEEEVRGLLEELKDLKTPNVTKLKSILKGRLALPFSKPKVKSNTTKRKKEDFDSLPTTSPEQLRYRDQKYIIDYYNSLTHPKNWEIAEGFREDLIKNKITPAEKNFKFVLKSLKIKYEFQHIVFVNEKGKFFILDFYLPDYNVGIEIDGGYHFTHEQYLKDKERTRTILKFIKIRNIIRFKNEEVELKQPFLDKVSRILSDSGIVRMGLKEFSELIK